MYSKTEQRERRLIPWLLRITKREFPHGDRIDEPRVTRHHEQMTSTFHQQNRHRRHLSLEPVKNERDQFTSSLMDHVITAFENFYHNLWHHASRNRILYIQLLNFRSSANRFNNLEHLLLNHLLSHQNRITEENVLHFLQSILCDEAKDFWLKLLISAEVIPKDELDKYQKESAKNAIQKNSKFIYDQLVYNPSKQNLLDFMKTVKKTATPVFANRAAG